MVDYPRTDLELVKHFHTYTDPILREFAKKRGLKLFWSDYHDWPRRTLYFNTKARDGRIYRRSIHFHVPSDLENFELEIYLLIDPCPSLFEIFLRLLRIIGAKIFQRRCKIKFASLAYPKQLEELRNILSTAKEKLDLIDPNDVNSYR